MTKSYTSVKNQLKYFISKINGHFVFVHRILSFYLFANFNKNIFFKKKKRIHFQLSNKFKQGYFHCTQKLKPREKHHRMQRITLIH